MAKNKKSLSRTLLIGCAAFILLICILMGALGFATYYNGIIDKYQVYLRDLLQLTMDNIDADDLAKCIETKNKSEAFEKTQAFIDSVKENYDDIEFIYIIKPLNDNAVDNVMDVMAGITAEEKKIDIDFYSVTLGNLTGDNYTPKVAKLYLDGMNSDGVSYFSNRTEYGFDYTGMMPIKDSTGKAIALLAVDKSMIEIQDVFYRYSLIVLVEILILSAIGVFVMYKWLRNRVIDPLKRLEESSGSFVESSKVADSPDDLKITDPHINTGDEMQSLSTSMNDMFTGMKKYMTDLVSVTKEKERIGVELNVATQIQADMLPRIFPAFPGTPEFDIYATMTPAKEVGGDFYDFFMLDETHLGMVIADVSGKGVPAALFMVISKTLIKNRALMGGGPGEILNYVNDQLCEGNASELFVTVWFAIFDIETGKGLAANAGHEHPAIKRKGGQFELDIYRHSPVVATMEGMRFREHEFELNPGDMLFVYTDGVPEATDANKELYGTDRMLKALNSDPEADVHELLANVKSDVDKFVGEAPQFDDLTMMAFEYKSYFKKK